MARHEHRTREEDDIELTEEEREEYEKGIITWSKATRVKFWFRKEWTWYYVIFVVIVVLVALMAFFHHRIVDWLTPFTKKLQNLHLGWLIAVAILFVLSFPPLFGNEIVMVLVGLVWGLGKGFAIVAAGTILGELANYILFKYWLRGRAERLAKKNLNYACLSQAIVEGGWFMAFVVRLSVIPTHISTVILAVCGLEFWKFCVALILGLPKQLITVYVGVVLGKNQNGTGTNSHIVSDCVFAATAIVTIISLWYIYRKMTQVRKKVLIGMRKDLVNHGQTELSEVPNKNLSAHDEPASGYARGGI